MLARDVAAAVALPGFDNSAMDGYAARWAEVATASRSRRSGCPWPTTSRPGAPTSSPSPPGTVQRIMTGAPLPAGADVVIPVELTDAGTEVVEIRDVLPAGSHLRAAGEDIAAGAVALTAGSPLGAAQLGLAAAVGVTDAPGPPPSARRWCSRPAASSSRPGQPLLPGQIYESNSHLLVAAVEEAGGAPAGCTSSPTTSTSSWRPCAASWPAPTC